MEILYRSTRSGDTLTASQAVLQGLGRDGGLFVPCQMPKFERSLEEMAGLTYQELAYEVMRLFLTDYTEEELKNCVARAYDEKFDTPEIAPLREADGAYYLELYHGATIAFKDMALSILPHLMTTAARKNGTKGEIVILTATSGDTGKAAMAGFADVPGTRIVVFYPKDGVSKVQEKQMVTQRGANTCVVAIEGNFDDAQTAVKKMFGDREMEKELLEAGFRFSSANSINIGRLVPQVVYYVHAYLQLMKRGVIRAGEEINITVPTGNFGNILAAYYAKRDPRFSKFLTEGRSFGPHGQELVIADSIENYDDALSRELTEKVVTANLEMRALGFKPFVAPAFSSGALSILLMLRGEWHCGSVYLGGAFMGVKNRYTPNGLETEILPLPDKLFERIRMAEETLKKIC